MIQKVMSAIEGKKTYIIAGVTFILGGLQAIGYPVPEYVYAILGALGLGALRAGVSK